MRIETMNEAMNYINDANLDAVVDKRAIGKRVNSLKRLGIVAAAAVLLISTLTAFSYALFSPLDGDEFSMDSHYTNGIITVSIENKSNKAIELQPEIKLMKFWANEEVQPTGDVSFSETIVPAHNTVQIQIDITNAYDIRGLETPLLDDYYYIVLTNNDFIFGHDWHCFVDFYNMQEQTEKNKDSILDESTEQQDRTDADDVLLTVDPDMGVLEGLEKYMEKYVIEPAERNAKVAEYYAKCNELLAPIIASGVNIVPAASPHLLMGDPPKGIVFDERIQAEYQWQLISENHFILDAYNIPLGASENESFLVISARIPQRKSEINEWDCGSAVPVVYVAQYDKNEIKSENDYIFVRGRLIKLSEFADHILYEDDKYVCYDVTDFVYKDINEHIDIVTAGGLNGYVDEGVRTRVRNISEYYRDKENAKMLFIYN